MFHRYNFREWDSERGIIERCAYIGHHITAALSFMWILDNEQLLYFANHRLLAEWSTPLLNMVLLSEIFPKLPLLVKDLLKGLYFRNFLLFAARSINREFKISCFSQFYTNVHHLPRLHNSLLLANGDC